MTLDEPAARRDLTPLFRGFSFGTRRLRNRIVMSPMTRFHSPDGVPGGDVAAYYGRRAEGGVGLIVTEGAYIDHPASNGYERVPAFFGREALKGWSRVVEAAHRHGAAIVPQLWHVGGQRRVGIEPDPAVVGCAPMDVFEEGRLVASALSKHDIREIIESYGRAARTAAELGFDGVEIHAAHGYLIDQFFWETTNRRQDYYGGSIENRTRFAAEVIARIKRELPSGMPLILRISQWKIHLYEARIANDRAELDRLLTPLVKAGVDIFHVSTRRFAAAAFAGYDDSLAKIVKNLSGLPVIAVGGVGMVEAHRLRSEGGHENAISAVADVAPVAAAMARGDFDLVAVGRALLADAEWANKLQNGRFDEVRGLEPRHLKELY